MLNRTTPARGADPGGDQVTVGPTRRAILAASAAAVPLLVTACRGVQVVGTPPPPPPDVRELRLAITAEQLMISRYHLAIARAAGHQAAATRLAGLLAEHQQHLAQLRARLVVPAGSAAAAPAGSPSAGPPLPADLGGTLGSLAAAEQAAAARLGRQLLAMPPSLAQLLASIAASEATHVPVLTSLRRSS
jgi:hypothetical protein